MGGGTRNGFHVEGYALCALAIKKDTNKVNGVCCARAKVVFEICRMGDVQDRGHRHE
jgi:hypothetical protein